jgi:hypothetical protein
MLIFRDGKCFEATLPDMTAGSIMPDVAANVRGHQPMHPATQIAVRSGPEREMQVIRHQTVGEDAHRNAKT